MMSRMKSMMRSEEGQGMTEYIIIVALIAIAAIGIITVFGQNIRALFGASAGVLGGDDKATSSEYGGAGQATKVTKKNLKNFGEATVK